ncbi:MAG: hypothetical protein ACYCZX_11350 [Rhodospirillaceae bacterium]
MPSLFRLAGFAALLALSSAHLFSEGVYAAEARKAPVDPTMVELQRAYDSVTREARAGDSLDNAYELLSLADTAQQFKAVQIAANAGTAFADLVRRATASALKPGSATARDTLDQFVDLRSAAYSVPAAQVALDDGMRALFPAVAGGIERKIATVETFEEKLAVIGDLATLQAAAVQVKMGAIAHDLGTAFDGEITALRKSAEADAEARTRRTAALDDALQAREAHLKDASENTIDIIAQRMQASPGEGPSGRATTLPKD